MTIKKKRKLFIDDGRPHGTVILNWHGTPEKEFTYIAEAFRVSAQEAVTKLRRNKRFGLHGLPIEDFRAYPIIFLYRHALELYMKAIVLVGSDMLAFRRELVFDREKLFQTHSLDVLRREVERVFTVYGWGWDLGSSSFGSVNDLCYVVRSFRQSMRSRTHFELQVDTEGAQSLEENFRFNVFKFASVLDDSLPTLEGAVIGCVRGIPEHPAKPR